MQEAHKYLIINKESRIKEIQQTFSQHYPYLKIEFCKKESLLPSSKKINASPESKIRDLTLITDSTQVNIAENRTVAELVSDFINRLGIIVQLFRKSGNIWNVISLTDSWTLENQNKAGEFISMEMKAP